jgi:cytochrome P450
MKRPQLLNSRALLGHLLQVQSTGGKIEPLDPVYVTAEILDNINAAEATVAVTTTYLIWRLSTVPHWQHRIRKELKALPKSEDGSLSFTEIDTKAPSLDACLHEVYRLHPASSGRAERIVPKGGRTLSGVHVAEGVIVTTSIAALHRNAEIFPDPERFAPERWLEADEQTLAVLDAHVIAFGYGGRICLGKALATMEIKVLTAKLYLKYETALTESCSAESMKQSSTHDAVPAGLECRIRFQSVE